MKIIVLWMLILSALAYVFFDALEIEERFQRKQVAERIERLRSRVNLDYRYPPFELREHESTGTGYWDRKRDREK